MYLDLARVRDDPIGRIISARLRRVSSRILRTPREARVIVARALSGIFDQPASRAHRNAPGSAVEPLNWTEGCLPQFFQGGEE